MVFLCQINILIASTQQEIRKLKRELLEKELQWKRQIASIKNQEVKAFTEWDMNSFNSQDQEPDFRRRINHERLELEQEQN